MNGDLWSLSDRVVLGSECLVGSRGYCEALVRLMGAVLPTTLMSPLEQKVSHFMKLVHKSLDLRQCRPAYLKTVDTQLFKGKRNCRLQVDLETAPLDQLFPPPPPVKPSDMLLPKPEHTSYFLSRAATLALVLQKFIPARDILPIHDVMASAGFAARDVPSVCICQQLQM